VSEAVDFHPFYLSFEDRVGFEPTVPGFASQCLAIWLPVQSENAPDSNRGLLDSSTPLPASLTEQHSLAEAEGVEPPRLVRLVRVQAGCSRQSACASNNLSIVCCYTKGTVK
jgi:hypothetical protein